MSTFVMAQAQERELVCLGRAVWILVSAIALLFISAPTFSQANQGTIRGGVFDQSGGAVAGATVTITDVARGVTRTLVTDSAGEYVAPNLTPGTYTVRADAKGFRTVEHSGVLVEVGQNIRVDLEVQPGEQTQTITVSGEVPAIDTTDATLGGTVSNDVINALPLNGRNFERLLQLRPGVVSAVGAGTGVSNTNGRRSGYDILMVDGIAALSQTQGYTTLNGAYRSGDTSSLLPIDAIQEFNTEENPKAEYGWREGSVITVGIKSGTNGLHGTAYAFGRDASATDAANYFTGAVTPATLEQFGASAGGRIIKDKLFWFASFEALRSTLGDTQVLTIPSDIAGPGATKSMVDACTTLKASGKAISPLSAQLAGLNTATCVVSPSSSTFENLFPYDPTPSNNFAPGVISNIPLNNGILKVDYVPGSHHHVDGVYYESKSFQTAPNGGLLPQWGYAVPEEVQMYSGDWTWTPNSTWVNDVKYGAILGNESTAHSDFDVIPSNPWPSGYGINTGVGGAGPLQRIGGLPEITFTGFSGYLGAAIRSAQRGPEGDVDLVESVSYLRGKHSFKFGFEYVDIVFDGDTADTSAGLIAFSSLQNFLQGIPTNGSVQAGNPAFNARSHWYAGFVQDDWRLKSRLTLNLGLRYEYDGPLVERNNYLGNFNPNVNPVTTPAIQQVGSGEPIPAIINGDKFDFFPRFGLAWDVQGNGRTVVRAGFGLQGNPDILEQFISNTPFGANFPSLGVNRSGTAVNAHSPDKLSPVGCGAPVCPGSFTWTLAGPIFPINDTQVINGTTYTGVTCTAAFPCGTGSNDPNYRQSFSAQWNMDLQRAITNNLTLDVAYVGVHGYRETMWTDLNQPPLGAGWDTATVNACIANPSTGCKPNVAGENAARPYNTTFPYLSYITQAGNGGYSNYNALQLTVQGRAYHGLSFLTGYTYSHSLDTQTSSSHSSAIAPDGENFSLVYGNGDADLRERLTFSPTYAVPGMKSPGQMLLGWALSSIVVVQGGLPWSPSTPTAFDWLGTGENSDQAIVTGVVQSWNYTGPRSAFTVDSANPIPCFGILKGCTAGVPQACVTAAQAPYVGNTQLQALALAALTNNGCYIQGGGILTPPAYGTIGNASRNLFHGPAYYNVDFSVSKLWTFKERYNAQFRAEFFNLFNRTDLAAPGADPSSGFALFGTSTSTPDSSNPVLGSGGPRHIQFGLKLTF